MEEAESEWDKRSILAAQAEPVAPLPSAEYTECDQAWIEYCANLAGAPKFPREAFRAAWFKRATRASPQAPAPAVEPPESRALMFSRLAMATASPQNLLMHKDGALYDPHLLKLFKDYASPLAPSSSDSQGDPTERAG